jgi:hypothetical protein
VVAPQRKTQVSKVGQDLTLPSVVNDVLGGEEDWKVFAAFCEEVLAAKEAAEREREAEPLAGALRRARRGRRRRTIARRLPLLRGGGQSACLGKVVEKAQAGYHVFPHSGAAGEPQGFSG